MFRIGGSWESGVKMHFAGTQEVADATKADLENRFGGTFEVEDLDDNSYHWDPGGMLMMGDEVFEFELDTMILRCFAQHFDALVDLLSGDYPELRIEGSVQYYKIHANYHCVCLTPKDFKLLKEQISNPDLAVRAAESFNNKLDKLKSLHDEGHIIQAVKDNDGKIYKAKLPEKKHLN